jgi:mannosyltransferase
MRNLVSKRLGRFGLLAVFILALLMRLVAINSRPLWYDEAFAVLFSERGPGAMYYGTLAQTSGTAADIHPLAYYLALFGWMKVFGDSPAAVRLLSIAFGMGIVLIAYGLGKLLIDHSTGMGIALLVAISPFQIHYSQEIRMYAMMTFFLLLASLAFWKGVKVSKPAWWILFAVSATLAQYTHNLAAVFLLPLAATPIVFKPLRNSLRCVIFAGLGALLLYIPWVLLLPGQLAKVQKSYWTSPPDFSRLLTTILSFTTNLPIPTGWLPLALLASLLTLFIAIFQTVKAIRMGGTYLESGVWMAYMAITPVVLLFIISRFYPVYIERALLPSGVLYLAWVAWSLMNTRLLRPVQYFVLMILALGMGMGYIQHLTYQGFPYAPYSDLVKGFRRRMGTGDLILHSNKLSMLPSVYYDRILPQEYIGDPPGSGSDTLALPTQEVIRLMALPSIESIGPSKDRVWFVIFQRAIEEYQGMGYETHPHLAWLNEHYLLERIETWGDLKVYVYQR